LGENNVFVSIYEAGSTDEGHTATMVDTFKMTLEAIGVEHHLEVNGNEQNARNAALQPLKAMYRSGRRVFNTLVMMNDDLWCTEELLELIYQSRKLSAAITCSTDVRSKVAYLTTVLNFSMTCILYSPAMTSTVDCSKRLFLIRHC
jgi:alpha-1,3-mannosyltransferase